MAKKEVKTEKIVEKAEKPQTEAEKTENDLIRDAIYEDIQALRTTIMTYTLDKVRLVLKRDLTVPESFAYLEKYNGFTKSLVGLRKRK